MTFVEGPEAVGFELQSVGYMQAVEHTNTKFWSVAASWLGTKIEGVIGHGCAKPQLPETIIFKRTLDPLRL
jgi:hypothetical protein